jgi:hypothetical protein
MNEQFPPPVVPSELVDGAHPATKEFLRRQVDMQIADIRLLFRLPVEELDPRVGCNLTAAAMMLNMISGFSRWFFHTEQAAAIRTDEQSDGNPRSKRRFIGFVGAYWPQVAPEQSSDWVAERLYRVRNSLVHDLGVTDDPKQTDARTVGLGKGSLDLDTIVYLERCGIEQHPLKASPVIEEQGATCNVHLFGVYWALHGMLRAALNDRPTEIESALAGVVFPEFEELPDQPPPI